MRIASLIIFSCELPFLGVAFIVEPLAEGDMKALSILLAITCLALTQPAIADPMPTDAAIFTQIFAKMPVQDIPVKARAEMAEAIFTFWNDFDSKIPRNSPAVTEWLNKELNTKDTQRLNRVTGTPEYALRQLAEQTDECLDDAKLLRRVVGQKTINEMYAWMRMAGCYNNPKSIEVYLQNASLSKSLFDGPVTMAHATLLSDFITGKIADTLVRQQN